MIKINNNKKIFSKRLEKLLEKNNITRNEFADIIGVSQQQISNYMNNDKNYPSTERLIAIAEYLNVSIDYLLGLSDLSAMNIENEKKRLFNQIRENDDLYILIKNIVKSRDFKLIKSIMENKIDREIMRLTINREPRTKETIKNFFESFSK